MSLKQIFNVKEMQILFYKQQVYKQLALKQRTVKQLSGHHPFFTKQLATIKNTDSGKVEFFHYALLGF